MVDSSITPAQKAFIDALSQKLAQLLGTKLDGAFSALNYPAGFPYMVLLPPNNYYSENLLSVLGLVPAVQSNGLQGVTSQRFKTLYNSILQNVGYVISPTDQAKIDKGQVATQAQQSAMISTFEQDFGTITPSQISDSKCVPATKAGYIAWFVQTKYDNDPTKIPIAQADFRNAYQAYLNVASNFIGITTRANAAAAVLAAALANSSSPSSTNGGLQISASDFDVAWVGLPSNNQIVAALGTSDNQVSIEVAVDNFSSSKSSLSIEGHAGFSIPIGDFLEIGFKGSAQYSLDKYSASATSLVTKTTYPGVTTLISTQPLALATDNVKGWYAGDVIDEIVSKTDNDKVTGYKLLSTEYTPADFGQGKKFARLKTWVLSQQPTVAMTFKGGNTQQVASNFQENASVSLKLFGLFDIGGASESYSVKNVDSHSVAGEVTVTLGPSKPTGTVPADQLTAYVLGGVIDYPTGS